MTKSSVCTEPALLNRMLKYKALADAFSYPEDKNLFSEYDKLFRQQEIWLYGAEYIAENEFQRSNALADIAGFYRAFGLETVQDRPDSLVSELEFMHYLIFKEINAGTEERALICRDAQRKFFNEHLYPAATKIAGKIMAHTENKFYRRFSEDLTEFLECERQRK